MDFGGCKSKRNLVFLLSLLFFSVGATSVFAQSIIINEVMYETSTPAADKEFVEIFMPNGAVNLSGFSIADSNSNDTLTSKVFDASSKFAVIVNNESIVAIPGDVSIYEVDAKLGNGLTHNDYIAFRNNTGSVLDTVNLTAFQKTTKDFSLERVLPSSSAFVQSELKSGSPGVRNNHPPTLEFIGNKTVNENQVLSIRLNASDPNKDIVTFSTNAASVLPSPFTFNTSSGAFGWTPTFDDDGEYTITFNVSDGQFSDTEEIILTVLHVNRDPVFNPIPLINFSEDTLGFVDLSLYASDPDNDSLKFLVVPVANLTILINKTSVAAFAPDNDFFGSRNVSFIVQDPSLAQASQVAKVTITPVNDAPRINSSPNLSAKQDEKYTYDVIAFDVENDSFTFELALAPSGMSITPTGKVTWTPNNTQVMLTNVSIKVTDSFNASTEQNFILNVSNVNDAPKINSTPITIAKQNESYVYTVTADDPDLPLGDKLTFSLVEAPERMGINPSTGVIAWVPQPNQVGAHNVKVKVIDKFNGSDLQPFTLTVTNVNDPPSSPQLISPVHNSIVNDPSVLLSWTASIDPDVNDTVSYFVFLKNTSANLALLTTTSSTTTTVNLKDLQTYSWKVVATDGKVNVSSNLSSFTTSFFNPPIITVLKPSTLTPSIKENETLEFEVNVTDPDSDHIKIIAWSVKNKSVGKSEQPNDSTLISTFAFTPSFGDSGVHNITFTATDATNKSSSVSFKVTVTNVNRNPVLDAIANKSATQDTKLEFDVTASDPDLQFNDVLTFSANTPKITITKKNASAATVSFTPTNADVGELFVTLTVTDLVGASDKKSFTIKVANTNDKPSITSTPVTKATVNVPYAYTVIASDPDLQFGDELNFSLTTFPANMTLSKISNTSAQISWIPNLSQLGKHAVEVVVKDKIGATAMQKYDVEVGELGAGAIIIVDQFSKINPLFGDEKQKASNPLSDKEKDENVFLTADLSIKNGGPLSLSDFKIVVSPVNGFSDKDLNISLVSSPNSLASQASGSITLRARVPEQLDAVDDEGEVVAFIVASISLEAKDSLNAPLKKSFQVFMQRANELDINDIDASVNDKGGKSLDDGDDLKKIKPNNRIELVVEVENKFDDEENVDVEDVDLSIECDNEDNLDFDDKTEEIGDVGTEDEEIESLLFDVEEDAEDEDITCDLMVLGVDENGARHGESLAFTIEVERKSHDLQIEASSINPSVVTCQTESLTLITTVRNLGKSNEDEAVVEIVSKSLGFQQRIPSFELDEDDTEDFTFIIPVPQDLEAGALAVQIKTFYDNTKTGSAEVLQVTNECGARKSIATKGPQVVKKSAVVLDVGQSSLDVQRGEFVSLPVRLTNPADVPEEFVVELANTGDFAESSSRKQVFLNPGQSSTIFLNLKVLEDAPPRKQSVSVLVRSNGAVIASEAVNVLIDGKKSSGSSSTAFWIIVNFVIIILLIFFLDKFVIRKY